MCGAGFQQGQPSLLILQRAPGLQLDSLEVSQRLYVFIWLNLPAKFAQSLICNEQDWGESHGVQRRANFWGNRHCMQKVSIMTLDEFVPGSVNPCQLANISLPHRSYSLPHRVIFSLHWNYHFTVSAHNLTFLLMPSPNLHLIVFARSGCSCRNFRHNFFKKWL